MQQDMQEDQHRAERIELLLQKVAAFSDPDMQATAEELVQTLLDMYGEGLARILELTVQTETPGHALIDSFASDNLLSSLFFIHGIHPIDLETRVARALDEVRPYLKSHGGNVEILKVEKGVVQLRLQGSCHGCPSSAMTLKSTIEEAINKAAPDIEWLEVEGVTEEPPRPAGIPVAFTPTRKRKDDAQLREPSTGWEVVAGLIPLPEGLLKAVSVQDVSLVFCKIIGTYYAYHNLCSGCNASLTHARLEKTSLVCSSCRRNYDVCRAGRCLDAPSLFLKPVPLLVQDGEVKVALSALVQDDQSQTTVSAPIR